MRRRLPRVPARVPVLDLELEVSEGERSVDVRKIQHANVSELYARSQRDL